MDLIAFDERMAEMRRMAKGNWTEMLLGLGVSKTILNRRNQPCPLDGCGGDDRFQYTDKFGEGNYFCRACGAGAGLKLLMAVRGLSAGAALRETERWLGILHDADTGAVRPASATVAVDPMTRLVRKLWHEARPIARGDPVDLYFQYRGVDLEHYPSTLRCHPVLGYYEPDPESGKPKLVASYAALLACVQDKFGKGVNLHRTYVHNGRKAAVTAPRKLLRSGLDGESVRLGKAGSALGTCEGIENGLAVVKRTGQDMWPALTAGNLEKLWVPDSVALLRIYGDNDSDGCFDGQAAAYHLARRFTKGGKTDLPRRAEVYIPRCAGSDWCEVYQGTQQRAMSAQVDQAREAVRQAQAS